MGNRITNKQVNTDSLKMSNISTSAFMCVLALSACDTAESGWEKHFAQSIVDKDQSYRGSGTVGFDICEIGWTHEGFEEQKLYVFKVIDMAMNEYRWDDLGYTSFIKEWLKQFKELIGSFQKQHINPAFAWPLNDEGLDITLCPKHLVYLNIAGCIICNDQPIDN
jgi:hypothetical protein